MSLSADALLDRNHLKQQLMKWRTLAILAVIIAAASFFAEFGEVKGLKGSHIARITVTDIITDDPRMTELLSNLEDNDWVKAVIVRIDSPGGTAVGGEQLYTSLRRIAEHKPVVATMRTMATSAGYMTALGADHIIAQEGTITGSIGVIMQSMQLTDLAEKLGVTPITIKSGINKATPSPFETLEDKQRALLQHVIDDFYRFFIGLVTERRQLNKNEIALVSDGRIFTGRQALDAKLVDQLGGEKEAKEWLREKHKVDNDLKVHDYKPKREKASPFELLEQLANGKIWQKTLQNLDGLLLIWQPNVTF